MTSFSRVNSSISWFTGPRIGVEIWMLTECNILANSRFNLNLHVFFHFLLKIPSVYIYNNHINSDKYKNNNDQSTFLNTPMIQHLWAQVHSFCFTYCFNPICALYRHWIILWANSFKQIICCQLTSKSDIVYDTTWEEVMAIIIPLLLHIL